MSGFWRKACGEENRKIGKKGLRLFYISILCFIALCSIGAIHRSSERGFLPGSFWYLGGTGMMGEGMMYVDILPTAEADMLPLNSDGVGPVQQESPFFLTEEIIVEPLFDETTVVQAGEEKREESIHWWSHKVAQGDTLTGIAEKYGISMALIQETNKLKNPHRLSLGSEILVPRGADHRKAVLDELERRKKEAEKERKQADPFALSTYVVRTGDSLWSIACKYDLDINTLFGCNSLKDPDRLKPGTTLRIPNQDGILYEIKKGDTLDKISKKFGIYPEAVVAANELGSSKTVKEGQSLFLPGAKPITVVQQIRGVSGNVSGSGSHGFLWPMRGRISSPFGWRRDPFTKRRDFHTGIDIKASRGTPIAAAKAGVVTYAGWMGGYGRVVVVNHGGGYTSLYAHCDRLLVRKGQRVNAGQRLARCGASGRATGTHLHFEVRYHNKPINPKKVLR